MANLSVNINKVATLRNSRNKNLPDVVKTALKIESLGVHGITVHPRPDERHIRKGDVYTLKRSIKTELNIEGYPSLDFLELIRDIKPEQCTLVPDPPEALTSNAGWDLIKHQHFLTEVVATLKAYTPRVSLFVSPFDFLKSEESFVQSFERTGAHRIELYTEAYADHFATPERDAIVTLFRNCSEAFINAGAQINAGHDLNLQNLPFFIKTIPGIAEVSIGHAIVSDALDFGWEKTIRLYLEASK